jgi:hypothetical protein
MGETRRSRQLTWDFRIVTIDGSWHNPDLQRPLDLGPIMATLPTFGAECRFIIAFQTSCRAVAKVGT